MKYKRLKLSLIVGLMASLWSIGVQAQAQEQVPKPMQEPAAKPMQKQAQAPLQLRDTTLWYQSQEWNLIYSTLSDGTKLFFGKASLDTTYIASGYFCLPLYRIESDQPTLNIPADYLYTRYPASLKKVMVATGESQGNFQSVTVPEGTEVFDMPGTVALTTLSLPSTIVQLDFTFTNSFTDLYLRSASPPRCGNNLANKSLENVTIHVPAMAMDLYANTSPYKSGNLVALEEPVQHLTVGWEPYTIQNTEGFGTEAQLTVPRWYSIVLWQNGKGYSSNVLTHNDYKAYEEACSYNDCSGNPHSYGNQTSSSFYPAQLTVNAESPLNLKKFRLEQDCGQYYFAKYTDPINKVKYKITPSTAIFNSSVTAQEIEMTYHLFETELRWKGGSPEGRETYGNRFHLVSFPFDIKLSDITFPPLQNQWNMRVICMEFDGEKHAKGSGGSGYWRQLSGDDVLHANHGYLINFYGEVYNYAYTDLSGFDTRSFEQTTLHVKAMDTENKQQIFANGDVAVPISAYPSKYKQRQGWNLIGNPYPCFFDIHHLDFTAPITVYDGFNYYAFSPIDDDYYLYPNEAFFLQCPDGVTSLTFLKEGRRHDDPNGLWQFNTSSSSQVPARRYMPGSASDRRVYNFLLNGEDGFDRTRVVINEQASTDYELEHDAAKMMGQGGPQLYVLDGGVQYAIDERPLENGVFSLGMLFSAAGSYVLSLQDNPDEQTPVYLTDLLTGTETDLTETAYTFEAAAGIAANRFSVRIGAKMPTPVQDVSDYSGEPVYYDLQGRIVKDPSAMQNGVYILKQGQITRKIVK